jgi:two-component system response regulator YesN
MHPQIKMVRNYIHEHYNEPITLQEVANHFYLNSSYLSHLIKRELGVTFTKYVMNLRLSMAQKLLLSTEDSIADIACKIGYEDYRYFLHLFKRNFKLTPKTYRNQNGGFLSK